MFYLLLSQEREYALSREPDIKSSLDKMATLGFREDRGHLTSLRHYALATTASVY